MNYTLHKGSHLVFVGFEEFFSSENTTCCIVESQIVLIHKPMHTHCIIECIESVCDIFPVAALPCRIHLEQIIIFGSPPASFLIRFVKLLSVKTFKLLGIMRSYLLGE